MLTVHSISKSFGIDTILKDVSFSLSSGERLVLIGPNGSGKTTLLRILAGQEKPDSGGFHFSPPDLRVAYLEQGMSPLPDETMGEALARAQFYEMRKPRSVWRFAAHSTFSQRGG